MPKVKRHEALIGLLGRMNEAAQSALPVQGEGCCPHCLYRFDPLLDRVEAWAYTGFMPNTLATWDSKKMYDLHPIKFGNAVRYRLSSLNHFVDERMKP